MSIRSNALWNLFGAGVPLLFAAVSIRYIVREAGVETFGILTLVWALIGYFSLFDFGIGRALTQNVSGLLSLKTYEKIPSTIKVGSLLIVCFGLFGMVVTLLLAVPLAQNWLKISPELQSDATVALMLAAIGIPLTTLTTGLRGIIEAYQDFRMINIIRIGLGAANFGFPAVAVWKWNHSITAMVISLLMARLAACIAHLWLVHRRVSISSVVNARIETDQWKPLMRFGIWMTVSNVVSPLMVAADKFFISGLLGASVVAYYAVPSEMLQRVLILPMAVSAAMFPALTDALQKDRLSADKLYQSSLRTTALYMLPVCILIAVLVKPGLTLWMSAEFSEKSWLIAVVLSIGIYFNSVAQIPFSGLHAKSRPDITAKIHLAELVFYIIILIVFARLFGILGAAIAWSIRVIMDFVLLLYSYKRV